MKTEEEYDSYVGQNIGNKKYFTDRYGRVHKRYFKNGKEIVKHSQKTGCVLVLCRKEPVDSIHFIKHMYCIVHETEVSRAGVPFGRSFDNEKDFSKYYDKDISVQNGECECKDIGEVNTL